jgi:hypothetical protein
MLVSDVVKTSGSKRWKALRIFVSVVTLVSISLLFCLYMCLNTLGVFNLDLKRLDALRNFSYQDNSVVFDRNGEPLHHIDGGHGGCALAAKELKRQLIEKS